MNERNNDRVIIFDTTLRDGEQAPGCSMTLREKLRVAASLRDLNVDVIEAEFNDAPAIHVWIDNDDRNNLVPPIYTHIDNWLESVDKAAA